jgi:ATP-dependent helicase/nuclease subunit B
VSREPAEDTDIAAVGRAAGECREPACAEPRLFTIPPGAPFLPTLTEALLDGTLVGRFDLAADPLALARATVLLPTRRAARAFAGELADHFGGRPVLLPRIIPLGDVDEAEAALLTQDAWDDPAGAAALPPIDPVTRSLLLAGLIHDWGRRVGSAVVRPDPGDALLVTATPADALALAGDLAQLMDTLAIEGRAFDDLKQLVPGDLDRYWEITLAFLAIAAEHWPNALAERGVSDIAAFRDRLLRERARLFARGYADPVIVAGSTGSMPATAELIAAIARLPRGAVVLPGLDQMLDDTTFAGLLEASGEADAPAHSHPQTLLRRLLRVCGIDRGAVRRLGTPSEAGQARERLLSEAMRPAASSDRWAVWRDDAGNADVLASALAGVSVVEASDEREEALAIAVALRETVIEPDRTAALVTPDRLLAERVAAELERWGIEIDDSAGRPLNRTRAGTLALAIAQVAADGEEAKSLIDLLAHADACFGLPRNEVAHVAAYVETKVLRDFGAPPAGIAHLRLIARQILVDRRPKADAGTIESWRAVDDLLARIADALGDFIAPSGVLPLATHAGQHLQALRRVAGSPPADSDAVAMAELLGRLADEGSGTLRLNRAEYRRFVERFASEISVHPPRRAHRRLKIWGPLEARLMHADRLILGGLVEAGWPPAVRTDAFLNRAMRAQLGLPQPERRIGQSAHDFVAGAQAADVVLTRTTKIGGVPAVPSRFLQRLATVSGPQGEAWCAALARGRRYLDFARALDRAPEVAPAARPAPRPPAFLQPERLSITEVETLVRDPYAIFARKVLRLSPIEPYSDALDPRILGIIVHHALEASTQHAADPAAIAEGFRCAALAEIAGFPLPPRSRAFLLARIDAAARSLESFERERRPDMRAIFVEHHAQIVLPLADGTRFELTGRIDRIERRVDGSYAVLDFKTGQVPSKKEIQNGYAPQLPLGALLAERAPVAELAYVKLAAVGERPAIGTFPGKSDQQPDAVAALVARTQARLVGLLDDLRAGRRAFVSRAHPRGVRDDAPTNHLARMQEWQRDAEEGA